MRLRLAIMASSLAVLPAGTALAQTVGPSTSTTPYVLPNAALPPGSVETVSLLTVGDSVGGYRLVGIPDGIGVWSEEGTINLLVNHELGAADGVTRSHGATGAFVSRWAVDPVSRAVLSGRDHNASPADVYAFDRTTGDWDVGSSAWDRFCSGDLADKSAFRFKGFGPARRIYLNGEETRPPFVSRHGRAYAHIGSGPAENQTWELPHLGQMSFENVVASPFPQLQTIVAGLDDSEVRTDPALTTEPSELYFYVGTKKKKGNDITRAGLTDGVLYGLRVLVDGGRVPAESNSFGSASFVGAARFEMHGFGDVSVNGLIGSDPQAQSIANDVTRFQRVEDGAWDPRPGFEQDFYFVTTATGTTNSRHFRVRFDDITQPDLGGTIEIILNGGEGQSMLDNMTVDPLGRVVLVEDPGGASRLAKVWMYDLTNKNFVEVAAHNAAFFSSGGSSFLTTNEEASGVIEAFEELGAGWYVLDVQAHFGNSDPELAEGGQLLALYIDPSLGR